VNKIYLNKQLKDYYSDCLEKEICNKNIDDGIIEHLRLISKSENIRPIFSKKGKDSFRRNLQSYLNIAYSLNIESKLMTEIIPHFKSKFDSNDQMEFVYKEIEPKVNSKRETTKENKGSEWLVNPDYFNISQIRFELKRGSLKQHEDFWNECSKLLSIL
jgi:hypothetical protein